MIFESKEKEIPVVDESDNIIFYKSRKDRNQKDIYRISVLLVFREDGKILLTKRGLNLKTQPGAWGVSVSGTLEKDETYETNVLKESSEEIGISDFELIPVEKIRISDENQNCFCMIYKTNLKEDVEITHTEEIADYKFLSKSEILEWVKESPSDFNTNFKYFIDFLKY